MPEAVASCSRCEPDCLVVAAYGQILPAELIDAPPYGVGERPCVAVAALARRLPDRARDPRRRRETGVSIMRMEAGLDTGPVYATARVAIGPDATTPALTAALAF